MYEALFRIGQLTGFPVLALVVYIAYKAGRLSDRLDNLSKRVERLEDAHWSPFLR